MSVHLASRVPIVAATAGLLAALVVVLPGAAQGAKSDGCEGGGFTVLGLSGEADGVSVGSPPPVFHVQGKYLEFDVVAATFAIQTYNFLPTDNELDMTNGVLTPVFDYKRPLHGGILTTPVTVELGEEDMVIERTGRLASGAGLDMKIQAKDCAQGGVFQMEVERDDVDRATGLPPKTTFVHRLADTGGPVPFYFDNQFFRDNLGRFLTANRNGDTVGCTPSPDNRFCVEVEARNNIGNDFSDAFVARDSAQGGPAPNDTVRVDHPECGSPQVPSDHCGGVSVWLVASGGRMGFVTGEDAVEVAQGASDCIQNCQARNRVRGRVAVLGFPFPVAADDRLQPRLCSPVRPECPL